VRRHGASLLLAIIVLVAGLSAWPAMAQTATCQLAPVFVMLRDLIGKDRVGECTGGLIRNEAGDLNQPTTRGIMTFRTSDLVVAFSDGQTTFLFGPNGLESRPSGSRLPWEAATTTVSAAPASSPAVQGAPAAPVAPVAASPQPLVPLVALPIVLDGDDSATTKPLDLAGGDYAVLWEAQLQRGKASCYLGGRLRRWEDQNPGALLVTATVSNPNDRTISGETRVFGVSSGRYVLDVMTTGCDWKIKIQLPEAS
jgi:hypothetical protein